SNAPKRTPPPLTAALTCATGTTSRSGMLHTARCNSSTAWNPPASVIDRTVTAIATHSPTTQSGAARKILSHEAGKTRISVACFLLNERGELNEEEEGQKEEVAHTEHKLERDGSKA